MNWENWLIAVSIVVIALAFVALAIFVIFTLISLRQMVNDMEHKVRALDPIFRVVNQAGEAIERKASHMQQVAEEVDDSVSSRFETRKDGIVNTALEVVEWAFIGLSLWQKIQKKRR